MSVLREEEIVTMKVLSKQGESNCAIARRFGVTEGTVRYHLKRAAEGASDGRADKPYKAEELAHVIEAWYEEHSEGSRPINVKELWEHLVEEYGYQGSYRSVLRFVRKRWGKPAVRTWRRLETPAGAQSQTDWGEFPRVELAEGPEDLSVFLMSLSHSRKPALVWSRRKDLVSWIHCHNRAFERLAGIPAVNRIDNVKTAIVAGAGAWGTIHPVYRAYSRSVGFHIDACGPRQAQAKGKVEAKVRLARLRVDPRGRRFDSLEHLQEWSDERLERWTRRAICPATGLTVAESWEQELERLAPLPILVLCEAALKGAPGFTLEVQNTCPKAFQKKLARVFAECNRVLGSDGLLVFTYHHSREEGWVSLAHSLFESGFNVVNAHPVKSEMSVATPKSQSKNPINIDIVLVCRNSAASESQRPSMEQALKAASAKIRRMVNAGLSLSQSDRRLVFIGQLLTTLKALSGIEEVLASVDRVIENPSQYLRDVRDDIGQQSEMF